MGCRIRWSCLFLIPGVVFVVFVLVVVVSVVHSPIVAVSSASTAWTRLLFRSMAASVRLNGVPGSGRRDGDCSACGLPPPEVLLGASSRASLALGGSASGCSRGRWAVSLSGVAPQVGAAVGFLVPLLCSVAGQHWVRARFVTAGLARVQEPVIPSLLVGPAIVMGVPVISSARSGGRRIHISSPDVDGRKVSVVVVVVALCLLSFLM